MTPADGQAAGGTAGTAGTGAPGSGVAPTGPLAGVTVLDLAGVGPAARATRLLGDYGATVVKIGVVPGAGAAPIQPPFYAYSGQRGTKRILLDLKSPEGRDAFLALAAGADAVIESFRPGVVDRLGVGYEATKAVNAGIVYCSTSGYGQSGPRASWVGHDIDYLGAGGFLASSGPRGDGGPPIPGATLADAAAGGMHAALAVAVALLHRRATGEGAYLDVSVADGVLWIMSLAVDEHLATGAEPGPGHDILTGRYACYDSYRARDGKWLAVGAIEPKFFANLCRALGCEEWIAHQTDDAAQDGIRAAFRAAFSAKDRDEWVAELAGAETCVAPVQAVAELGGDPQFAHRRAIVEARHPQRGTFRQVGPVLAGMPRPAGTVDVPDTSVTDTEELLSAAGYDAGTIEDLREKGVVA